MLEPKKTDSPTNTINLKCRINPRDIAFLTSIFEGFPGYALLRTDDAKKGWVQLWIAPDLYDEVLQILDSLKSQVKIVILEK